MTPSGIPAWRGHPASFADSILRGVGQVMLQDNRYAGALFLAGIFYNSWRFGLAVLVGTIVSTLTAMLFAAEPDKIRSGVFGFNGALTAVALAFFLRSDPLTWAYIVFAAVVAAVLTATLGAWLEPRRMPVLTAPFVVTALCFLLASTSFGRLHPTHVLPAAELPTAAVVEGIVGPGSVLEGFLNGIAQVFFQRNVVTGVLFALGLLVSSRRAFAAALAGSLLGVLVAWVMGAPEPSIRAGVFGFNAVLTAIAMDQFGFARRKLTMLYTVVAIIATTVVFAATSAALQPLGMPALTLPFVVTVWLFLPAARRFAGLCDASARVRT